MDSLLMDELVVSIVTGYRANMELCPRLLRSNRRRDSEGLRWRERDGISGFTRYCGLPHVARWERRGLEDELEEGNGGTGAPVTSGFDMRSLASGFSMMTRSFVRPK